MDDEALNKSLRAFLKKVGITSQQEIEQAIGAARHAGTLPEGPIKVTMTLNAPALDLTHEIEAELNLG